jgi:hypothetical protein
MDRIKNVIKNMLDDNSKQEFSETNKKLDLNFSEELKFLNKPTNKKGNIILLIKRG